MMERETRTLSQHVLCGGYIQVQGCGRGEVSESSHAWSIKLLFLCSSVGLSHVRSLTSPSVLSGKVGEGHQVSQFLRLSVLKCAHHSDTPSVQSDFMFAITIINTASA